jgi:hypothetical protein
VQNIMMMSWKRQRARTTLIHASRNPSARPRALLSGISRSERLPDKRPELLFEIGDARPVSWRSASAQHIVMMRWERCHCSATRRGRPQTRNRRATAASCDAVSPRGSDASLTFATLAVRVN